MGIAPEQVIWRDNGGLLLGSTFTRPFEKPWEKAAMRKLQASRQSGNDRSAADPAPTRAVSDATAYYALAIERRLPRGTLERSEFDQLCRDGCERMELLSFFITTVFIGHCRSQSIYGQTDTSFQELKKLADEADQTAQRIERSNTFVQVVLSAQFENLRGPDRQKPVLYRHLPKMLRVYAADLRLFFGWVNTSAGPKNHDSLRGAASTLVQYVVSRTGRPHYDRLVNILNYIYLDYSEPAKPLLKHVRRSTPVVPAVFLSAITLKQCYLRAKKRGFVPEVPNQDQRPTGLDEQEILARVGKILAGL